MKKLFIFPFSLFILIVTASGQLQYDNFDCSTIIVGKKASSTGHVLIGHNEDDGGKQVVNLYKVSRNDNPGSIIKLRNGAELDQPDALCAYIWMEMPGQDFADCFLNENGVIVVSNSCPSQEQYGEITNGGIGYYLRKILAERAVSARHAVELAGEIISRIGYNASGRTYTIADTAEAWMFSVVRGKHWAAMRVPDDHVVYLPNYYIIRNIDFNNSDNFLCSPELRNYAIRRGWYSPDDGEFNFREVYGNRRSAESMSNIGRMWTGVNSMSPEKYDIGDEFPVSFRPDRKIGIDDIIKILGNHYEGTQLDESENYAKHNPHENKTMNICAGHQQLSFVAELRSGLPVDLGCRLWIAPRRSCVNAYVPVYYGIDEFPDEYQYYNDDDKNITEKHFSAGEDMYDSNNGMAWWLFADITNFIDKDYKNRIDQRRQFKNKMQKYYYTETESFDKGLINAFSDGKDTETLRMQVSDFSKRMLEKYVQENTVYFNNVLPERE